MKYHPLNLLKLLSVWAVIVFLIASCTKPSYANRVQCKITELALAGYNIPLGAYSPLRAFFMRNISMHPHFMGRLERDTFECADNLVSLSANPFQLLRPHLAVNGEAPANTLGAH